jgi:hypothetical protein
LIGKLLEAADLGDQLEIVDALTDCHAKLVGIDHPAEGSPVPLTTRGFSQQVPVLTEEDSVTFRGTVEKPMIIEPACTVLLGRQDIHVTKP